MKKAGCIIFVGFLTCFVTTLAFAAPYMQEGLWEITSTVNMPGMSMPAGSFEQCITSQDLVPQNTQPGEECSISNVRQKGDRVLWTLRCVTPNGKTEGSGQITYKGKTFSGEMQIEMIGQQGMQIKILMEGRRIGDCP